MANLSIGDMRYRVELQSAVDSVDSFGQAIRTWATYFTAWAQVLANSGVEVQQGGQLNGMLSYSVTLRTGGYSVSVADRIVWNSKVLNVQTVVPLDGMKKFVRVSATEVLPNG
jgi:SPP1 family predicted phage head-tail adaptor